MMRPNLTQRVTVPRRACSVGAWLMDAFLALLTEDVAPAAMTSFLSPLATASCLAGEVSRRQVSEGSGASYEHEDS